MFFNALNSQLFIVTSPQTDIVLPVHGRNKPIALGQVGLRCRHCKDLNSLDRAHHAVAYPSFISGVYNSVQQMFRLHFDNCERVPNDLKKRVKSLKDSTSNRGGRKQYWQDSAKRIGLVDTSFGIHFGRDPADPLPPLGGVRDPVTMEPIDEDDPYELGIVKSSVASDGDPIKIDFLAGQEVTEPEYYPLVTPEDRPLITDYLYLALEQMQPCNLMDADRVGCYKGRRTGFPGLACKHCVGQAGCGRYFPASEASLSQTTTSQTVVNHVRNCRRCPIEIREELELMKRSKNGPDYKKQQGHSGDNKPKHGGRKVFFHRLWCRIQRIPLPKTYASGEIDSKPSPEISTGATTPQFTNPTKKRKSLGSEDDNSSRYSVDDSKAISMPKETYDSDFCYSADRARREEEETMEMEDATGAGDFDMEDAPIHPTATTLSNVDSPPPVTKPVELMPGMWSGAVALTKPDDVYWLSEQDCYLRQELIQFFTAEKDDVASGSAVEVGQAGIRCVWCARNVMREARLKNHACFPKAINSIQEDAADLKRR
jgi:hypothetical protein